MPLHNNRDIPGKALWARDPKLARFAENRRILRQWDRKPQRIEPLVFGLTVPSWRAVAGCVVALASAVLVVTVLVGWLL